MTAVAALSVRRLHPQAQIILVMDEPTARAIDRDNHALRKIVTGIVVRSTGTEEPCVGARYLRTILRQLIKGDYLYLDSDTVEMRRLDRTWGTGADVAVVCGRIECGIAALALPGV